VKEGRCSQLVTGFPFYFGVRADIAMQKTATEHSSVIIRLSRSDLFDFIKENDCL
jgi:hypothetical protein